MGWGNVILCFFNAPCVYAFNFDRDVVCEFYKLWISFKNWTLQTNLQLQLHHGPRNRLQKCCKQCRLNWISCSYFVKYDVFLSVFGNVSDSGVTQTKKHLHTFAIFRSQFARLHSAKQVTLGFVQSVRPLTNNSNDILNGLQYNYESLKNKLTAKWKETAALI